MCGKYHKGRQNIKTPNSEKEPGSWKGRRAGGASQWVTGTEGGTCRDEHWVLLCVGKLNTNKINLF